MEPIRDGVNRLLDRADPILAAYREHRIGAAAAARRMGALERRFAAGAVRIAVEALAARQGTKLPADLQVAGRGEIAPSPDGS